MMNLTSDRRRWLHALCVGVVVSGSGGGAVAAQDSVAAGVHARLEAYRAANRFPGATLGVAYADGRVIALATGMSDTARGRAMRPDDLLLMGSVGKTYVAALALALVREGRLDLESPASRYVGGEGWFDSLPNASAISVRHLMTHTSGLVRYEFRPEFTAALTGEPDKVWDPREQVRYLHGTTAPFVPGAGWDYSDTNYLVLGLVLERILGQPIDDAIRDRFLRPLGLTRTIPSDARSLPGVVQGYAGPRNPFGGRDAMLGDDGRMIINPQFEGAGGGYAASAGDAARWGARFFGGSLAGAELQARAVDGVVARGLGPGTRYGLGIIVRDSTAAGPMHGHSGFFPGYLAEVRHYPGRGITLALLVNTSALRLQPSMARWLDELAATLGPTRP